MALRWTAAGMLGAERHFGRIISYRELARLAVAIGRDRHPDYPHPDQGGCYAHPGLTVIRAQPPPGSSMATGTSSRKEHARDGGAAAFTRCP